VGTRTTYIPGPLNIPACHPRLLHFLQLARQRQLGPCAGLRVVLLDPMSPRMTSAIYPYRMAVAEDAVARRRRWDAINTLIGGG
jgi:hypothetical protein